MAIEFPVATGDICEIILPYQVNGVLMQNTLHFMADGAASLSVGKQAVDDLVATIVNAGGIRDKIRGLQAASVFHMDVTAQMVEVVRRLRIRYPQPNAFGLVAEPALPPNVAMAVTKRGAIANKNNRGRLQIGGLPVTINDAGNIDPFFEETLTDLCELLDDAVNVGTVTWNPVIYNRKLPAQSPKIVDAQWEGTVRVQRTRTVGRGQ